MKPLRPQLRGLIFKLTLFYVLLSLPCLVLVETGILAWEFNDLMSGIDGGSLTGAAQGAAAELARTWPGDSPAAQQYLQATTEAYYGALLFTGKSAGCAAATAIRLATPLKSVLFTIFMVSSIEIVARRALPAARQRPGSSRVVGLDEQCAHPPMRQC